MRALQPVGIGLLVLAMMRAPWLPPKARMRNAFAVSGYGIAAASTTIGRTGLPVCTAFTENRES